MFEAGLPNADARASTNDDIEVWGLFYPSAQDVEGEPVAIELLNVSSPNDQEPRRGAKIVWRATGDEDVSVVASSPAGEIIEPFWLEATRCGSPQPGAPLSWQTDDDDLR